MKKKGFYIFVANYLHIFKRSGVFPALFCEYGKLHWFVNVRQPCIPRIIPGTL